MASYLVGAGSFSGPLSESALLRERIADNAAIAGQEELNQMAFNQSVVVTVPGNTRFYIVFQKTNDASGRMSRAHHTNYGVSSVGEDRTAPSLEELRQLLQLRQELSQLYPQGSGEMPQSRASQNQQ